jgi:hypothetical protein
MYRRLVTKSIVLSIVYWSAEAVNVPNANEEERLEKPRRQYWGSKLDFVRGSSANTQQTHICLLFCLPHKA